MACHGAQQNFSAMAPNIVEHNLESRAAGFLREGCGEVVVRQIERDNCIRANLMEVS